MGECRVSGLDPDTGLDKFEHPCYKCLTKACCSKWCSGFFRWVLHLQETRGYLSEDTLINFVVKYSRNEKWTKKD